jgi:hypothetical protein
MHVQKLTRGHLVRRGRIYRPPIMEHVLQPTRRQRDRGYAVLPG